MSLYQDYLQEIADRKEEGLHPKPIDGADLLSEIIAQIKDPGHEHRSDSLKFLIYNTLPGTTSAAGEKAALLKEIILGETTIEEIAPAFAFELLSHMKGGTSINVLLDLALCDDPKVANQAAQVLKTQVFLYEADMERLKLAFENGNAIAKELLESYAQAEFFTSLPEVPEEIQIVTYIAGEGDISTDLLSPGNQAHSRSDRELHGKCLISESSQKEIEALKRLHPDKSVMHLTSRRAALMNSSFYYALAANSRRSGRAMRLLQCCCREKTPCPRCTACS